MSIGTRTAAVIVIYQPNAERLAELIAIVCPQVHVVVVVCNSPALTSLPLSKRNEKLLVVENPSNLGLGTAQNQGVEACRELDCEFIVFFDQDSLPPEDLVSKLIVADRRLVSAGIAVGAVGPLLIDKDTKAPWPYLTAAWLHTRESCVADERGSCKTDFLYSSGTLVRSAHFQTIGGFLEPLFIDHVDLEWCYRASSYGLQFFGVPAVQMKHRMGEGQVRFLGRLHPLHSAERDYFVFRNSVILLGLGHIPLRWKINEIIRLIPRGIFYALIGKRFFPHLASCMRGMADGIKYNFKRTVDTVQ